jgi:hypothetical protein
VYFVRKRWEYDRLGKTNLYVAMNEDIEKAEAIRDALNAVTGDGYSVVDLRSYPAAMGCALRCNQTYITKPLDRSDNHLI